MTSLMTLTTDPGEALLLFCMTSHSKSRVCEQNVVRGMVSFSMVISCNEDTRSNREKMRPFPRESRTSSTRGMGRCLRELIALRFLQVCNPDVRRLSYNRFHRTGVRGGRMLDENIGQELVENGVGLVGKDGVDAIWTASDECTIRWNGNLERDRGASAGTGIWMRRKRRRIRKGRRPKRLSPPGTNRSHGRSNVMSRRGKDSRSQMRRTLPVGYYPRVRGASDRVSSSWVRRQWERMRLWPQGCCRVGRGYRRASVGARWKGIGGRNVTSEFTEEMMRRNGRLAPGR